jgi:magnesium transporter
LFVFAIVIWASFVAAILPLVLHRLRIDPAVVSGPFISTLVDGTGLIIYFTIAQMLLHV